MHGSAQVSRLPLNNPYRIRISVCRPGKRRNPRLAYSIRYQKLIAFGIVSNGVRIAEADGGRALRGVANDAFRSHVAVGRSRVNRRGVIAIIGDPNFIILDVNRNTHGAYDSGARAADDSYGRSVAGCRATKYENGVIAIVGDRDLIVLGVDVNSHGPVQPSVLALDGTQWFRVGFGGVLKHGKGRRQEMATDRLRTAGHAGIVSRVGGYDGRIPVVRDDQFVMLRVPVNAVRIRQARIRTLD